MLIKMRHFLNI